MPCLLGSFAFFLPRVAIVLVWLFGNGYFGRAYQTLLWPLLGFFFLPLTTLAYAYAINTNSGSVSGGYLVLVIIAVLFDLGVIGGGAKARRRRRET